VPELSGQLRAAVRGSGNGRGDQFIEAARGQRGQRRLGGAALAGDRRALLGQRRRPLAQGAGTANKFQAWAYGNLDCDALYSTFMRGGNVDSQNNVQGGGGLFSKYETE